MIENLHKQIEKYVVRFNFLTLSFFICILTLFFSMPPFDSVIVDSTWEAVFQQIKDPFHPIEAPVWSHNSKLTFRLFPVFLGKIFCLNKTGYLFSLFLSGYLIILVSFSIILRILKNKYKSFLLTISFAFIYAGKCSFLEFRGIFDGYAVLFLLLSLYHKNTVTIYFSILLAAFTDERALIASGFVFLNYLFVENEFSFNYKYLRTIFFSWISYFSLRYFLMSCFAMKTSTGGISLEALALNFELFPLSLYSLFEGFWIVILLLFRTVFSLNRLYFFLILSMLLISLIPSYLVIDVSRSLVFSSILIFIAIEYLMKYKQVLFSNNFCLLIMVLSFIYPCYVIGGNHITWIKPVLFEYLFRFFTSS